MRLRILAIAMAIMVCAGVVTGCTSERDDSARATLNAIAAVNTTGPARFPTPPNRIPAWPCRVSDPARSLRPLGTLPRPGRMLADSYMAQIQRRGKLVVGVDQNTAGFGYRDAFGTLRGFEIDLLKEVARAIFGDPGAVVFRSVTSAQRIPAVANGDVDIVASLLSIICSRWQQVDFTTEYYEAAQGVLVRKDSPVETVKDLNNQKVCATHGSTSIINIRRPQHAPHARITAVPFRTDCLVLLQQGAVDAVSADNTILAGFMRQDPNTRVLPVSLERERYGMAIDTRHPEFVRFVNGVLDRLRRSGELQQLIVHDVDTVLNMTSRPTPRPEYRS